MTPSEEFIRTYVDMFGGGAELKALFDRMHRVSERTRAGKRAARYAQRCEVEAPQALVAGLNHQEIARHYVTEVHEADCRFGATGAITELRIAVQLRARTPWTRLYYAGAYYEAERRRGVLQMEALEGLLLLNQEEDETGAVRAYFATDRPLDPEDDTAYNASYRVLVNSVRTSEPRLVFHSRPAMLKLTLRATFDPGTAPRQLWHFGAPNMLNIQHTTEAKLEPFRPLVYEKDFQQPIPNWCYGFSWLW